MTVRARKTYEFAKSAQWAIGLVTRGAVSGDRVVPLQILDWAGTQESAHAARAPAVSERGDLLWLNGTADRVCRRWAGDGVRTELPAPFGMRESRRVVAWQRVLWVLSQDGVVRRFDRHSLQQLETISAVSVEDIAPDGCDGVWLLGGGQLEHWNAAGDCVRTFGLAGQTTWRQLASLEDGGRLALLAVDGETLGLAELNCLGTELKVDRVHLARGFAAGLIASNGRDRLAVSRLTRSYQGGAPKLTILSARGDAIDEIDIPHAPTGLAARGSSVWVATDAELRRYDPDATGARTSCLEFLTPTLVSPEGSERGWLRAELDAELLEGSSLSVRFFASDKAPVADAVNEIAADGTLPQGVRLHTIVEDVLRGPWSEVVFRGERSKGRGKADTTMVVPLHGAQQPWLWLHVKLESVSGAKPPTLRAIRVRYPDVSLMEKLPAIYRSPDGDHNGFLRNLISVLEASSSALDERIEGIGRLVDPTNAPDEWLDYLAEWLGMPWHEQLPLQAKRNLLSAAGDLLTKRGTREAVLLLLNCVAPGLVPVVIDSATDLAPAIVGANANAQASRLPIVLLGCPRPSGVLGGARTALGHVRLNTPVAQQHPLDMFEGHLRIELTAAAEDRERLAPIVDHLLPDFVPVGLRLAVRWRLPVAHGKGMRVGTDALADDLPALALDKKSALGATVLSGERAAPTRYLGNGLKLQ